ncbi:MAG: hypothetical protein E7256_13925 [Lachnospiraceae bacterium]|nr:hypothetical protein [Lachnospiraceae bacterium]
MGVITCILDTGELIKGMNVTERLWKTYVENCVKILRYIIEVERNLIAANKLDSARKLRAEVNITNMGILLDEYHDVGLIDDTDTATANIMGAPEKMQYARGFYQNMINPMTDVLPVSNDQIPVCRLHAAMMVCYKRCEGRVTYYIVLWNDGNVDASNIVMKDVMPGVIKFPVENGMLLPNYIKVTGGEIDENMPPMIGESHLFTVGIRNVKAFGTSGSCQVEIMVTGELANL